MKIFGLEITASKGSVPKMADPPPPPAVREPPVAVWDVAGPEASYTHSFSLSFDGEKNQGEMGPIINYSLDNEGLRSRSWQLFLESDLSMAVLRKFTRWVIGNGLKLQAQPQKNVLKLSKIELAEDTFNKDIESLWSVYANSKHCDYSGMRTLGQLAKRAHRDSIIGGDVLVVLRVEKGVVTVQLVDGAHLVNPSSLKYQTDGLYTYSNGNRVRKGVELDKKGQHVAYHIKTSKFGETERIVARDSMGFVRAYLVYGLEYRLDDVRGLPLISAVMETAKKLDRYKEATLGAAEERAKIPFTIEHNQHSDGSSPLESLTASVTGQNNGGVINGQAITRQGEQLAKTVAATTNKQTFNMPIGSTLKSLESKNELVFEPFFNVNIDLFCATVGIPTGLAMSKYDSNYSASRAQIKDWEHTLITDRKPFADDFYQPIYNLTFYLHVVNNRINAVGYLQALADGNWYVVEAYQFTRWVGASVPHIDPLKEVKAEREKLGSAGAHLPLTTVESATENLSSGDSDVNMEQYAKEIAKAEELGIKTAEQSVQNDITDDEEDYDNA